MDQERGRRVWRWQADAYDPLETVMPRQATEDQSKLLTDMRTRVESAAAEIDRLTTELTAREEWVDDLETILDVVLGFLDTPVVVVGDDRRIRALSRGAGARVTGDAAVGKALSAVLPEDVFEVLEARLATAASGSDGDAVLAEPGSKPLDVQRLPGGGAVVVFGAG
jgi:nitrogen fixation/metabolism regulation signal transduction histidine kinase